MELKILQYSRVEKLEYYMSGAAARTGNFRYLEEKKVYSKERGVYYKKQ